MQVNFGSGALWGERTDVTGSGIGPRQFAILKDITINAEFQVKELFGEYQFPLAIARGQGKITGKASYAQVLGRAWSDIFFGATPATGQFGIVQNEADTVPSSTSYVVTVAQASSFNDDLGVVYASGAGAFNRVSAPAAAGQYAVNFSTGVYTFSASDAAAAVLISYTYKNTTTGLMTTITNQLMGTTPTFKATFSNPISPGPPGAGGLVLPVGLRLNACTSSKFSLSPKIDDWEMQELDFQAFADATGTIGYLSSVQ